MWKEDIGLNDDSIINQVAVPQDLQVAGVI
jgi:hypothetical protein